MVSDVDFFFSNHKDSNGTDHRPIFEESYFSTTSKQNLIKLGSNFFIPLISKYRGQDYEKYIAQKNNLREYVKAHKNNIQKDFIEPIHAGMAVVITTGVVCAIAVLYHMYHMEETSILAAILFAFVVGSVGTFTIGLLLGCFTIIHQHIYTDYSYIGINNKLEEYHL